MADCQLPFSHPRTRRQACHLTLLSGSSALALVVAAGPALAGGPLGSWNAAGAAAAAAAAHASQGAQQAAAAVQQSTSAMSTAAAAIRNMWTAQAAARAAALGAASRLSNGLGQTAAGQTPGLVLDPRVTPGSPSNLWIGADPNLQTTTSNGVTTITIHETAPNAVLTWEYFNVGPKTVVVFDQQGHANWTVVNRVDGTGSPSEIAGQLKADGTLALFNPNGFIFRAGSQTTAHTLIASSLDISSNALASVFTTSAGPSPTYVAPSGFTFLVPPNEAGANQAFAQNGLFPNGQGGATGANSAMFSLGKAGQLPGGAAITVEAGASITSTKDDMGNGGYVALMGAKVTNAGAITATNGQIILAAGGSVILGQPLSTDTGTRTALSVTPLPPGGAATVNGTAYSVPSAFPSLNGGGLVINDANGLLVSNDGAVTLVGDEIQQKGGITVTTSVTRPGSIVLSTLNGSSGASGNITLDSNSTTTIAPDESSGTLPSGSLTGTYFADNIQPKIAITPAGSFDMRGGAVISAPSAALTINTAAGLGTVLLETGSVIDLSGKSDVTLPMSLNEVPILVTANEVADDPLARSLIGKTVVIDARLSGTRADGFHWVGSPILDAGGFVATIPKTIDELLTAGGSFKVTGPQNFIQQPGAAINVSGGSVTYLGGMINTTKLLGADGRIYDIGSANPNIAYLGVAGSPQQISEHAHWGVTDVFTLALPGSSGQFEAGYVTGRSAGSVGIAANVPILEGSIVANTVQGRRQNAGLDPLPTGASLSITFTNPGGGPNPYNVVLAPQSMAGSDPFGLSSFRFGANWTPTLSNNNSFPIFSDVLTASQFGSIAISGENKLTMRARASLSVRPGGSITLVGVSAIEGSLTAPGGKINIAGFAYGAGAPQNPPSPFVVIGPDAVINVRGRWVNDASLPPDGIAGSAFVDGGSVSISTQAASLQDANGNFRDVTQSIVLATGSIVDLSSGGYIASNGKIKLGADGLPVGKGGSLSLSTYIGGWQPPPAEGNNFSFNTVPTSPNVPNQASVVLGGAIYAAGFDGGGTFALQAPTVTIDGGASTVTAYLPQATLARLASQLPNQLGVAAANPAPHATSGEIVLPTSFFASGFSQYTLTSAYGSTTVTAGTDLKLQQTSFLPSFLRDAPSGTSFATGALPRDFASVGQVLTTAGLLKPVNLTLIETSFQTASAGDVASSAGVLVDSGASIEATPGAAVSLVAGGPVTVLGSISARAGSINLFNDPSLTDVHNGAPSQAPADVWIGSAAKLDVTGAIATNPLISGSVTLRDGGTITLGGSSSSTIVVQQGAQLALGGASGVVNLPGAPNLFQPTLIPTPVWSNGGTLQIAAGSFYFAGAVNAAGGAPNAIGGTLTIGDVQVPAAISSVGQFGAGLAGPSSIVVEPSGNVAEAFTTPPATAAALNAMRALAQGGAPSSIGFITAGTPRATGPSGTLDNSGFDSVNISANTIAFAGSVNVAVPDALTLAAGAGHFVLLPASSTLLPAGITDPTQYLPPPCPSCVPAIGQPVVDLQAAYVHLIGHNFAGSTITAAPHLADGTLNVNADWIDLQRTIAIDDAVNVNFNSTDAIRLLPDNYGIITGPETTSRPTYLGALFAPGNLSLTASEIAPVTDTQFLLMSLGTLANDSTLTVGQNGVATAPLSAGGTIVLDAQTIVQGGTLWAPLGNIVIGLRNTGDIPAGLTPLLPFGLAPPVTQNVRLAAGSVTSVSAAGLQIPFGYTVDGQTWYQGTPNGNNANLGTALAAPPPKAIDLFGASITEASGATVDASGGGDVYATEFTAGTGGTRNVLTTYEINLAASSASNTIFSAQYADGRQVYALVPSYDAKVAAYDPTFANYPYYSGVAAPTGTNLSAFSPSPTAPLGNGIAPGTSITISAGGGIAAGSYVLLPGMYATLPGAYRVVQVASNVSPVTARSFFNDDGSVYVTGYFGNALTGARSALASEFQLQSNAVWQRYSLIDTTSGTAFFRNLANTNGTVVPPLPIDGGVLTVGATTTLKLDGSNNFAAAGTGQAGQIDISAKNILVIADDLQGQVPAADKNYLILTADRIGNLGASSVLIGGTAAFDASGETITADATNVEILTDAAHPLSAPDLTLVTGAGSGKGNGLTVDQGSVIKAVGQVTSGPARNITIGSSAVNGSGDGAMLRVANGPLATVNRVGVPATPMGKITIGTTPGTATLAHGGPAVEIDGGDALTVDTSGTSLLATNAKLIAKNYDLSGSVISVGTVPAKAPGLTLTSNLIASFAGANSVSLRSASFFNFYDAAGITLGSLANPIGTLTLGGNGIYHSGGTTTIEANNVVLKDSDLVPGTKGALTGTGGALNVAATDAITIDVGATASTKNTLTMFLGGTGTGTTGNFGSFSGVNLTAAHEILFAGIGSSLTTTAITSSGATVTSATTQSGVLNAGSANVTLTAPAVVVVNGSAQTLTTTGGLTVASAAGNATATTLGGSLNLTAASITDSGSILAPSGIVTFTATSGDITLANGASISAAGSAVTVLDQTRYAPGGAVLLSANSGNVTIDQGATIDVSAAGNGYAGALTIQTQGVATLNGALKGGAAFNDLGGNFSLTAGSVAGALPFANFTGGFGVTLGKGDIAIAAGTTLTSKQVALTANGGSVIVDGTIDASGPSGGQISVYGTGGVTIDAGAQLLARFKADDPADPAYANGASNLVQNGGTITLGTTGAASGVNAANGYENVASSGAITVASGAILDVSGGPGGANVSNTGGQVILRAPILANGSVNVGFHGTLVTNLDGNGSKGGGVVVDAYATWSTADACTNGTCATIDASRSFAKLSTDQQNGLSRHFDGIIDPAGWFYYDAGGAITRVEGKGGNIFTPTATAAIGNAAVYQPHVNFFQQTLVDFVQKFSATADFTGAQAIVGGAAPGALPSSLVHTRPDIALVNPNAGINGGTITVASNWNLGAGAFNKQGIYIPFYRTTQAGEPADTGEAGVLTLRAVNDIEVGATVKNAAGKNITVSATIGDGFFEQHDAFNGSVLVANEIANNPQAAGKGKIDPNTTSAASLMSINPGFNNGSFSYDFVAGAAAISGTPSADPNAVIPVALLPKTPDGSLTLAGDFTMNGHTSYHNAFASLNQPPTISIPSLVRTGTGSITVAAAGDFELSDKTAPGAVYTAGAAAATPAGFAAPTITDQYKATPNGLLGTPSWAAGGGSVAIAVGQSIIGIEMPTDDRGNPNNGIGGSHTGVLTSPGLPGGPMGQFWSDWYEHYGLSNGSATPFTGCPVTSCQTAAWVNYNTFFQGVGALGGGNISLVAGKDITDIGASLPETLVVSGGGAAGTSAGGPPVATYFGGGNLTVKAGGNINSSDFLVGRGTGRIEAGQAVQFDAKNPVTGQMTLQINVSGGAVSGTTALPLLLAVQDGFITLNARGPVTLGNVYDPASLPLDATVVTPEPFLPGASQGANTIWSNFFTTFGPQSGVAISSTAGDVTALTVASNSGVAGLFVHNDTFTVNDNNLTADTVGAMLPATLSAVALSGNVIFNPADVGSANLVPSPTVAGNDTGNISIVAAKSLNLGGGIAMPDLLTGSAQYLGNTQITPDFANYISPLGVPLNTLTQALHANDLNPVVIAAGRDIDATAANVSLIKPAQIEAGRDIFAAAFTGQNNNANEITSIVAGRDLIGGTYALYGPGTLLLDAGRNMGPFGASGTNPPSVNGVVAIGNGTNVATAYGQSFLPRTYLPHKSADIYMLFGVGPGINYQGAIDGYVNPANAGTGGIDFLSDIAAILGLSRDQAWTEFQKSPVAQQHLLVDRAFLDFLGQVVRDRDDTASPYFGNYRRAYTAIETLFPAAYGYTDNTKAIGNNAAPTVPTGSLNVARSVVATQMNSDINIIGPGGGITVGSAARDILAPVQEGILTLAGGAIRAFTDTNILLNQSRILTLQGGAIDLFTANGSINAGEGPKNYVSDPPISVICDQSGFCYVNPSGLVSGAGIGALITVPNEPTSKVTLGAPRGTIDAGAAGIRSSGGLYLGALTVLNAYNVQVGSGGSFGFAGPGSTSAATVSAPTTATTSQQNLAPSSTQTTGSVAQPSIIIVEVLGYGGGDSGGAQDQQNDEDKRRRQQP